jgi:hypothetical protein
MKLSEKQIKEFQSLHREVFGYPISKQQAMADGLSLIRLAMLIQPIIEEVLYGNS